LGNQVGECDADGVSLATVAEDCASNQQVCDLAGACLASVVDTVGDQSRPEETGTGGPDGGVGPAQHGNVIDVHSSRLLTRVEVYAEFEGTRFPELTIYKLEGETFEFEIGAYIAGGVEEGWISFSLGGYRLDAGERYLFSLTTIMGGTVTVFHPTPPQGERLSFGLPVGSSKSADAFAPIDPEHIYLMRFTTQP
jgi:hypothetical protein